VLRTSVPEASIDENGDAEPRERHISAASKVGKGVVHAEAEAAAVEQRPESDLRSRVPLSL
jgi:hypothetical protein